MHIKSLKYGDIPGWRPDRLCSSVSEAAYPERKEPSTGGDTNAQRQRVNYSYVVVATKALPGLSSTAEVLRPIFSRSGSQVGLTADVVKTPEPKSIEEPVYVLMQNGLNVERELYDALVVENAANGDSGAAGSYRPRILSTAVWIGTNLVSENVVEHSNFVS